MLIRSLGLPRHRVFLLVLLGVLAGAASGADTKSAGGKSKEAATREKPVVRLPPYFADIVKDNQRAKILDIRQEFAPRIQKKRSELKALLDEQDEAIWKVLTPAQRNQIEAARAAARANRELATDEADEASNADNDPPVTKKSGKADK